MSLQNIKQNIVANSNSKIYHDKDCYYVSQILEHHKVNINLAYFDEKGNIYRPCTKCLGSIDEQFNNENKSTTPTDTPLATRFCQTYPPS